MTDIPTQPVDAQPPAIPVRQFLARIIFENGQGAEFKIQSFDHIGALAKTLAALSDMPLRVSRMELKDVTDNKILQVQKGFPLPPPLPPSRR